MTRCLMLVVFVVFGLAGCSGGFAPDCSPLSDLNIKAAVGIISGVPNSANVLCPKVGAGYTAPSEPDAHDGGFTITDACASCIASDCKEQTVACIGLDGGAPCSASTPAYAALSTCIADTCTGCPELP